MSHVIGGAICWLLRRHAWRRVRKHEPGPVDLLGATTTTTEFARVRVCRRCGATRLAKARKAKT